MDGSHDVRFGTSVQGVENGVRARLRGPFPAPTGIRSVGDD
jgi:hypothetical protein